MSFGRPPCGQSEFIASRIGSLWRLRGLQISPTSAEGEQFLCAKALRLSSGYRLTVASPSITLPTSVKSSVSSRSSS